MEITDFGFFRVSPSRGDNILRFNNDDGQDWYTIRHALTQWDDRGDFVNAVYGALAMVDDEGVVTNVEFNPSNLMPGDRTVLGIDADYKDIKPGMKWDGKELT